MRGSLRPSTSPSMIDELQFSVELLETVFFTAPEPLATADPPRRPGLYLLLYDGDLEIYSTIKRRWPIYAGNAADLAERFGRHRSNLVDVTDLSVDDFTVVFTPLASHGLAHYAEWLATDTLFKPVWNQPSLAGFGSRFQGNSRTTQQRCPWSVLHPGRRCSTGTPKRSRTELLTIVDGHLAATAPAEGVEPFPPQHAIDARIPSG
ncbi:unannotated protein [freshwater metagenome]|uniref:Unannotated protein n=1 Tax=freshwater metagenome TaxID=449393 RepID=A0A6J7C9E5_9ZZZZ